MSWGMTVNRHKRRQMAAQMRSVRMVEERKVKHRLHVWKKATEGKAEILKLQTSSTADTMLVYNRDRSVFMESAMTNITDEFLQMINLSRLMGKAFIIGYVDDAGVLQALEAVQIDQGW